MLNKSRESTEKLSLKSLKNIFKALDSMGYSTKKTKTKGVEDTGDGVSRGIKE